MRPCELLDTPEVEMYFYGELDPAGRARVETHLRGCEPCRQRLDDLHEIRRALASRAVVDAPPAGDWSGFTRRLDSAIARGAEPSNLRTSEPRNLRTLIALAALLALVTIGVVVAMRVRPVVDSRLAATAPPSRSPAVAGAAKAGVAGTAKAGDRALREGSAELLERSKLVVLGLATRDPRARSQDWQYERELAGALLNDTRLYRQAAFQGGASDVERVMRDLETVLLEASMSDRKDPASLERVQRLIAKRDLVVKMQVMAAAGPAGN
jgi:hypothetical protein